MTISEVVEKVAATARRRRAIWLLRILAHGDSGVICLGSEFLIRENAGAFKSLRDYFTPGGIGIALHSCGPASHTSIIRDPNWFEGLYTNNDQVITIPGTVAGGGGRGVDFLRALAAATQVPVRGGINSQMSDARYRYEGTSIVVAAGGRMVAVPDWGRLGLDTTRILP